MSEPRTWRTNIRFYPEKPVRTQNLTFHPNLQSDLPALRNHELWGSGSNFELTAFPFSIYRRSSRVNQISSHAKGQVWTPHWSACARWLSWRISGNREPMRLSWYGNMAWPSSRSFLLTKENGCETSLPTPSRDVCGGWLIPCSSLTCPRLNFKSKVWKPSSCLWAQRAQSISSGSTFRELITVSRNCWLGRY